MYIAPRMTTYRREDLQELMGPVETQYVEPPIVEPPSCEVTDVDATPDNILPPKTDISLSFNFSQCTDFATANVSLINAMNQRLLDRTFIPADGMISSGTIWTLGSFDFGFLLDPGDYMIEVILTDSSGFSSDPQFTSFTVL